MTKNFFLIFAIILIALHYISLKRKVQITPEVIPQNEVEYEDVSQAKDGKSAYKYWLEAGNTGTESDYINDTKNWYLTLGVVPNGADNTAQIAYYVNKAKNEGKTLFIKKYVNPYVLTDEIAVTCSIFSDGAQVRQTSPDKCIFTLTNQEDLSLKGIKLDVNATTASEDLVWGKHVGIKLIGSRRIKVTDVELKKYWGAGISLNNCFDCKVDNAFLIDSVSTTDLWATSTEHGDTDISLISDVAGARNMITNCRCLSHKSSIGIWCNAHGKDTMSTLKGNFCAALLPDLTEAPAAQIKKRHGIQLGYFTSENKTFNRAVGNFCFNTGTTGISVASRGNFQTVDVSDNICRKNGTGSVDGAILRGGIMFQHFGFGSTCGNNKIYDFQTVSNESGALSIMIGGGVAEEGTLTLENNYIEGSLSHGIYLGYSARNCNFINTTVKNSAMSDVWYFDMTADAKNIKFENLQTYRSNANYPSVRIQNVVDLKGFSIKGGKLRGTATTYNEDNVGVWLLNGNIAGMSPILFEGVEVENFGIGFGVYNPFNADIRNKVVVRGLIFTNCEKGVGARQADTNGLLPVFDCVFHNVTDPTHGWGYAKAAKLAQVTYTYS